MNRLGSATSPYLLQHKDNPVDWWEWTEAAFAEARRRDVPVLISVGYSACHWCHVMAHESFEDESIGALINEHFVAIKVDREERPDVDAIYMQATQAMTGQGGWPMTVFATPDGEPFYCGTYFPKEHFRTLLGSVDEAWRTQREAIEEQGKHVVEAIAGTPLKGETEITAALLDHAGQQVLKSYDQVHGGFGGAPKFPPHMLMLFMLRGYQRSHAPQWLEAVRHTAEAMARGGLYDQLAGGFHRYTVDATWTVPHFEKMLYDNALLMRAYTEIYRLTKDSMAQRVALETAEFLLQDLRTAEGGFASALDADTDGVEGLTYAWNREQLREVTGDDWAADLFGVTEQGNFEHGLSVLRLMRDVDEASDEVKTQWRQTKATLLNKRARRPQPQRDDKIVASWNGLAITALVELARLSKRGDLRRAAVEAGELLANVHLSDGRIKRVSRDGKAGEPDGVLEDYGCVAEAFCALHQVTNDGVWLTRAKALLDTAIAQFGDGEGGFFDTAADAERLVTRPADPTDNATPSGLSSLVSALLTYTALTSEPEYHQVAQRALESTGALLAKFPRFAGYAAAAAEALLSGPVEVAVTNDESLYETALMNAPGGAVIVNGQPDEAGVPLLAGRTQQHAAYVCRGFVCDRPVTSSVELTTMLRPPV
ncbi:thioredoxin domain-containing protein [Catelliglobosispora koreensis]|uniref:thioredoxin domain-containing protein n=1 Tax=Catelliglobosispora koreensis TaxID=129052 RepID=UPI0003AA5ABD|nr:thioredoxin domain-containing protein [Catelliglobosispora koreensis]